MAFCIHLANTGRGLVPTYIFNPALRIASATKGKIGGLTNKAFGSSCYAKELSVYPGLDYQICPLKESIEKTELS